MEKRPFTELGLSPELLKAVNKMGFEEASPIQTAVIPLLLEGRDVVGQSATGSGKTAAFGIPAVERIDPSLKKVQAIILCPTRELAVQVAEEIAKLAFFKKGVREVPIFGGQSYERQFRALEGGAQIVIGTPGRVMDHMERGTLKLDALKLVILDEADRMLDMGFRDDIERILAATPAEGRQSMFFSATMPPPIKQLIQRYTNNPAWVKIEALAQNAPKVDQVYMEVDRRSKVEALTRLIDLHDFRFGIIFCATKIMVDELAEILSSRGYSVDRLHGDITQTVRTRVMDKFRRRGFEFLIATDVAARGLDVDDLEVVFNYDLPNDAEDYTHRVGRTGRAGRTGKAFTFVSGREVYGLENMIRYARIPLRRERVPSLDQVEEARESVFFEKLRATLDAKQFRAQDRMIDRLLDQGYNSSDIAAALIHLLTGGAPGVPGGAPAASEADSLPAPKVSRPVDDETIPPRPVPAPAAIVAKPAIAAPKPAAHKPTAKFAASVAAPVIRSPEPAYDAAPARPTKQKYDRVARTGREPGYTTVYLNVGRKNLVTPADVVGKIAGVTRLPAAIVGAMDIHQRHTLVDVLSENANAVVAKMAGIRVKNVTLEPALATDAHRAEPQD
ncbi:MAG: DEAD/DEAH box helicase [Burkholderiales bacterium]|nr:DEAD/DEAH box helicase [Opitutaceae bacterium]